MIAIAGAGPAGVAAALTLARRGLAVTLFDRARFPRDKPCGEGLLPTALAALARLGLDERVRARGCPIEGIEFAIAGGPSCGGELDGLGIPRRVLDALLVDAARAEPGVTLREGVAVLDVVRARGELVGVATSAGVEPARALIVADGLRSPLRRVLGLEAPPRGEPRLGLRAHYRVARLPFGRRVRVLLDARVEYYLTPVAADQLEVAILGTRAAFESRRLTAATFAAHLASHATLSPLLAAATPLDRPLGAGPLRQRARALFTDGVLLCGDASGYLDAITGEGIGLALSTGIAAAQTLSTAPSFTASSLSPYSRAHATIVRPAERLTHAVLFCANRPRLAKALITFLSHHPPLLQRLLSPPHPPLQPEPAT